MTTAMMPTRERLARVLLCVFVLCLSSWCVCARASTQPVCVSKAFLITHAHPKQRPSSTSHHSARFLGAVPFGAASAALAAYFAWMLRRDAAAKGLANPLGSYGDVFFGGGKAS